MLTSFTMARAMAIQTGRLQPQPQRRHGEQPMLAAPVSAGHLSTYLKNKPFLPEVSYADLLDDIAYCQKALQKSVLKLQLKQYNELYWVQKLFCEKPSPENITIREIPFSALEHQYQGQAGQFELFNALCELREHRLITLNTNHPYQVGITRKGRQVMQLLKRESTPPPAYSASEDTFSSISEAEH